MSNMSNTHQNFTILAPLNFGYLEVTAIHPNKCIIHQYNTFCRLTTNYIHQHQSYLPNKRIRKQLFQRLLSLGSFRIWVFLNLRLLFNRDSVNVRYGTTKSSITGQKANFTDVCRFDVIKVLGTPFWSDNELFLKCELVLIHFFNGIS